MSLPKKPIKDISDERLAHLVATNRGFKPIFKMLGITPNSFAANQLKQRILQSHSTKHFLIVPGKKKHNFFKQEWLDNLSRDEFAELIGKSNSFEQFCRAAGLPETYGKTYIHITKHAEKLGVDLSHFTVILGKSEKRSGKILSLKAILTEDSDGYAGGSTILAKRLIQNKVLPHECGRCHIGPIWRDRELKLRVFYKNNNKRDLRRENLMLVCPNCEEQLLRGVRSEAMRKSHAARRAKRQAKLNGQSNPKLRP